MYSLRGEEAEEDISLKGLCEINLASNKFNSATLKDLCYFLQYDGWTRSINLRKNDISEEGIAEINSILDANESLIRYIINIINLNIFIIKCFCLFFFSQTK